MFKLFSLGIATNRDEWVYDFDEKKLTEKIKFFFSFYEKEKHRWNQSNNKVSINDFVDRTIKWTSELENHLKKGSDLIFNSKSLTSSIYRPYVKFHLYYDRIIIHRPYQQNNFFPIRKNLNNKLICISGTSSNKPFQCLAVKYVGGLDCLEKTQCLPLYSYDENGTRVDNITDWGLNQFISHYNNSEITREDIFHYVYAVLHNPEYRSKYEQNLKRELPRIPFYDDFHQWAARGKELMNLHINFETVEPYPLERKDNPNVKSPQPKLKADKDNGAIIIDTATTLYGVPKIAWEYKFGTYSALQWILEQYKEKKIKDPTIT